VKRRFFNTLPPGDPIAASSATTALLGGSPFRASRRARLIDALAS